MTKPAPILWDRIEEIVGKLDAPHSLGRAVLVRIGFGKAVIWKGGNLLARFRRILMGLFVSEEA